MEHITSAGSTYYVPSPKIGMRNVISNSLEKTTDRQLESLWRETKIGSVLPREDVADEVERPLAHLYKWELREVER